MDGQGDERGEFVSGCLVPHMFGGGGGSFDASWPLWGVNMRQSWQVCILIVYEQSVILGTKTLVCGVLLCSTSLKGQLQETGKVNLTKDEADQLVHILCFQDLGGVLVVLVGATLETVDRLFGGWVDRLRGVFPGDLVFLALAIAGLHVFDLLGNGQAAPLVEPGSELL